MEGTPKSKRSFLASDAQSATAKRRERLLHLSSRGARSALSGTEVTDESDLAPAPLGGDHHAFGDSGHATLVEELFVRLSHHGVRRCLEEGSASDTSGSRRLNYYLCVPCEVRLTPAMSCPPTEAHLAAAEYHCSSASHRLFARFMSLPEIDHSLLLSPIVNPETHTTIVVNGLRTLVSSLPGGGGMFDFTAEMPMIADDCGSVLLGQAAGGSSSALVSLHRGARRRIQAHQVGEGQDRECSAVISPTPGTEFLYNPLGMFIDPKVVWVSQRVRMNASVRINETAGAKVEGSGGVVMGHTRRIKQCRAEDSHNRGEVLGSVWRAIPAVLFRKGVNFAYTFEALQSTAVSCVCNSGDPKTSDKRPRSDDSGDEDFTVRQRRQWQRKFRHCDAAAMVTTAEKQAMEDDVKEAMTTFELATEEFAGALKKWEKKSKVWTKPHPPPVAPCPPQVSQHRAYWTDPSKSSLRRAVVSTAVDKPQDDEVSQFYGRIKVTRDGVYRITVVRGDVVLPHDHAAATAERVAATDPRAGGRVTVVESLGGTMLTQENLSQFHRQQGKAISGDDEHDMEFYNQVRKVAIDAETLESAMAFSDHSSRSLRDSE